MKLISPTPLLVFSLMCVRVEDKYGFRARSRTDVLDALCGICWGGFGDAFSAAVFHYAAYGSVLQEGRLKGNVQRRLLSGFSTVVLSDTKNKIFSWFFFQAASSEVNSIHP